MYLKCNFFDIYDHLPEDCVCKKLEVAKNVVVFSCFIIIINALYIIEHSLLMNIASLGYIHTYVYV